MNAITTSGTRRTLLAAVTVAVMLGGCTTVGPAREPASARAADAQYRSCAVFFRAADNAVEQASVGDAQTAPVAGYPYLRVNRFIASFRDHAMDEPMRNAWVNAMQALAEKAWGIELTNLPRAQYRTLARLVHTGQPPVHAVHACAEHMRRFDFTRARDFQSLLDRAHVPDEYRTAWRIAGLYPLSAVFVSIGISRYHSDTLATFATPLSKLPVHGTLVRYIPRRSAPLAPHEVAAILKRSANNALHVPDPAAADRDRLLAAFAPEWEVDVVDRNDRIGTPVWTSAPDPQIDTSRPVTYGLLSHTWWRGRALLQLNYVVWFPSRPADGVFDIYAGQLDGITLRVTLGEDGRPLLYDSMHNCGCYHMFFPSRRIRLQSRRPDLLYEPPLRPQTAPRCAKDLRLTVRVAHRTHFVQRLYTGTPASRGVEYTFAAYDHLRELPTPDNGHRSLFNQDGIVPGTGRAERWLLWPMGVPEPGAMRQWGHHAIAFVGRRHFDDPDLLNNLFEPARQSGDRTRP